jgi:hypothetical protein
MSPGRSPVPRSPRLRVQEVPSIANRRMPPRASRGYHMCSGAVNQLTWIVAPVLTLSASPTFRRVFSPSRAPACPLPSWRERHTAAYDAQRGSSSPGVTERRTEGRMQDRGETLVSSRRVRMSGEERWHRSLRRPHAPWRLKSDSAGSGPDAGPFGADVSLRLDELHDTVIVTMATVRMVEVATNQNPCGRHEEPSRAHSPRRARAPDHALGMHAMGCRLPGCVPLPRCGTHRRDHRGHGGGDPHARNRGGRRAGSRGVHNPHRGCAHVLHASDVLPCAALLAVSSDRPVSTASHPR